MPNPDATILRAPRRYPALRRAVSVLLAVASVAALASLVLEYGFRQPPLPAPLLHLAGAVVIFVFILDHILHALLARGAREHLRDRGIDFALILLAGALLALAPSMRAQILAAGALYVLVTQTCLLVRAGLRLAGRRFRPSTGADPAWAFAGGLALLILLGSGLLMLPVATPDDKPLFYHDALFTAASAACVTGLVLRPTGAEFTPFGQATILALVQAGGLAVMLYGTVVGMRIARRLSSPGGSAGRSLETEDGGDGRVAARVLAVTFLAELAGAVLLYPMFRSAPSWDGGPMTEVRAAWASVFHSISAFCNAGFSLYGANLAEGVREGWASPLRDSWQVLGVIAPLIVIGGIGFPVLQECARGIRAATARILHAFRGSPAASSAPAGLSLHSKVALLATVVLIVAGAEGLLLVEPPTGGQRDRIGRTPIYGPGEKSVGDWQDMDADGRAREAVFQSISARTGGLSTFDLKELSNAGKLWLCGLMVVGAGPAGAGGGMRTVTVALLLAATVAALRRRRSAEAFRRAAGEEVMNRFLAAAVLYASLIGATTLLLAIAMRPGFELVDLLFEACSACGNVGLSTGVTHSLNLFGQGVVVAAMFLGRVGLLSLLAAASGRMWAAESQRTPLA